MIRRKLKSLERVLKDSTGSKKHSDGSYSIDRLDYSKITIALEMIPNFGQYVDVKETRITDDCYIKDTYYYLKTWFDENSDEGNIIQDLIDSL